MRYVCVFICFLLWLIFTLLLSSTVIGLVISVMASGNEIILEWNGSEMNANEIIDRMESVGYITPDDFIGG